MKQNTFYVLAGIVGLIEVGAFWLSVQYRMPFLITAVFIAGIVLLYWARRLITDRQVDERAALITQKAGMATFMVFWVIFFATSLGGAVIGLGAPRFPHPPRPSDVRPGVLNESMRPLGGGLGPLNESFKAPSDGLIRLGYFGYMQLALLFLMFFLYVGFRIYYARKYGEWETDEEQD
ncbi:MAG: DUF2178 domain-containing protein [Methanoregulaceae archaeon]|nr:DUF2178 domain-containing protein [Methanoregulaceae archaeon]